MSRASLLGLLLLLPLCMGVVVIGPYSSGGAPNAPILWAMDFEVAGGPGNRGCEDTDGDTCSHFGGGVTGQYTGGVAPLEQDYSALKGIGYMYADAKFTNGGTTDVTMDFLLHLTSFQNLGSNLRWIAIEQGGGNYQCAIIGRPAVGTMWAYTSHNSGAQVAMSTGTTYRIRMELRQSDSRCRIYFDTTASAWGTGGVGVSSAIRTTWNGTIDGMRSIAQGSSDLNYIIDDIAICEGVNIVGKCGD